MNEITQIPNGYLFEIDLMEEARRLIQSHIESEGEKAFELALAECGYTKERKCKNEDTDYDAWFKCSECGLHSHLEIMSGGYDVPNYCPNCGAKVVR